MNNDFITQVLNAHIKANKLTGDYEAGMHIWKKFIQQWQKLPAGERTLENCHNIANNVVSHYNFDKVFDL